MSDQEQKYSTLPNIVPGNVPQIFEAPFKQQFCEIYNCQTLTKYLIGKREPSDMWRNCLNICENCAKSIISTIPEELKKYFIPPRGYVLAKKTEAEEVEGLQEQIGHLKIQVGDFQKENEQLTAEVESLKKDLEGYRSAAKQPAKLLEGARESKSATEFKSDYQSSRPKPFNLRK